MNSTLIGPIEGTSPGDDAKRDIGMMSKISGRNNLFKMPEKFGNLLLIIDIK